MSPRVPLYITSFNHLTWTKALAKECERLPVEITILDNGSTYQPLLDWFRTCPYQVIRQGVNRSCYAFWSTHRHHEEKSWYVVTDNDLDISGVPADAIDRLIEAFRANPWANKAGLSLECEDIPDSYPLKDGVLSYERNYWQRRTPDGNWRADVGATFALYNQTLRPVEVITAEFYRAVRLDRPYCARHVPWYLDPHSLSEEDRYMFSRVDNNAFWSYRIKRLAGV